MNSESYDAGYAAFDHDEPRESNPYPDGSLDADQWDAGWDTADDDDGDACGEGATDDE